MRPIARWILNGAIIGGLVLAAWPFGQNVYGRWSQQQLEAKWQSEQQANKKQPKTTPTKKPVVKSVTQQPKSANQQAPTLVTANERNARIKKTAKPWPLTKLTIPDIDLSTFVVQGWDDAALKRGPGHDPNSSLPGEGNCAIAGHRNVYGSFFYRLDELLPGAPIILENRDGRFTYTVNRTFTTTDTDISVLKPPPEGETPLLTLVTCTIPHTNNRIILQATLLEE